MMSTDFLNEMTMDVLSRVKELEKKFSSNDYNGNGYSWFELCKGDIPKGKNRRKQTRNLK